jgi:hypothetical protein
MKKALLFVLLLSVCFSLESRTITNNYADSVSTTYRILDIHDYTFKQLLNEGINTAARQLDVLHVPVRQFGFVIKWHIKTHRFVLNKGKNKVKKTTFRAIAFAYPSVSPKGDTIMLSGLVTIPIINDNKPANMLVYHRIVAPSYQIAPSNSLPIEAVLTADNTICVFPDYYGCGITEGEPFAYTALNYHARCATDCVLTALTIIKDAGIELDDEFYTWNMGYSQGGGYALAMHKYIETELPDSLASQINLKWSLCGDGVYTPIELYKNALATNHMGSTPAVYLEGLRSIFYSHPECLDTLQMSDFFSEEALNTKLDSLLLVHDDSLWDMVDRLDELVENKDPRYYFAPTVLDTCSAIFEAMAEAFDLDDCAKGWHPSSTVVLYHSKRDKCIPYKHMSVVYPMLSENDGDCCLYTPVFNGSHVQTSVLFYAKFLRLREDKLFKKYTKSRNNQ